MINRIVIVIKLIDILKKSFEKMMFRNTAENALFDKEERQIFNSSSFTFATFVLTFIVNSLNQLLNLELLKSIKTLKKKNKKKQRDRKRRAKSDIDIIYLRKKFKDSSRLFSTFKNVIVDVVFSSNSITLSIINEIINEFVAWIIQFTRVTKNNIAYNELFNVAEILIVRKTILKMIQEKKEFKHMNWW